jgi:hypothetical protein
MEISPFFQNKTPKNNSNINDCVGKDSIEDYINIFEIPYFQKVIDFIFFRNFLPFPF